MLEAAAGRLVRDGVQIAAVERFVGETWAVLAADQASKPYSETRNLPTMLVALAQPTHAYGINTEPVSRAGQALLSKQLFTYEPMTGEQYRQVLALAERVRDHMRGAWNWKPRDLWDVQSFVWVTCQKNIEAVASLPMVPQESSMPTNLILYGPPGTGKTYATAVEAVRLCGETVPADRAELMATYRRLSEAGRIEFVTFHQSMAYDDFVEGLRPVTGGDGNTAGFELQAQPGLFRKIARRAETSTGPGSDAFTMGDRQVFKMSLGDATDPSEAYLFEEAIEHGRIILGFEDIDWSDAKYENRDAIIAALQAAGGRARDKELNAQSAVVQMPYIFRNWMKRGDLVIVSKGTGLFRAIGVITGDYRFTPRDGGDYAHQRDVEWLWVDRAGVPVDEIYSRRFSMRTTYQMYTSELNYPALVRYANSQRDTGSGAPEPFVLVIDEINRANISKVLGELITLLEPDKRLGRPNELKVRLPYSGDLFGVPANLHIVGTMNTADRSIALIDKALRRRFTFREMMPEPDLLREVGAALEVDLPRLLRTLNDRIEYLLDREHQIGHAWLMGYDSRAALDATMRDRIIPLIAEYFFEDWGKVADVLGGREDNPFLERITLTPPPGMAGDEPRYRWRVRSDFAPDAYQRACG